MDGAWPVVNCSLVSSTMYRPLAILIVIADILRWFKSIAAANPHGGFLMMIMTWPSLVDRTGSWKWSVGNVTSCNPVESAVVVVVVGRCRSSSLSSYVVFVSPLILPPYWCRSGCTGARRRLSGLVFSLTALLPDGLVIRKRFV